VPRLELRGRAVAITGGARGIGRATAEACARAGMRVALGDLDAELAGATAAELGADAVGLGLDVRDRDAFDAFLTAAEEQLGALDVLVNNAGVFFLGQFRDETPEHTRLMVEVNLTGVMTGSQLALERFLPRGAGHIVNIASSAGQIAVPGAATYAATKHAVVGFTRALRGELRASGVRTTIVMPGIIRTEMIGGYSTARATRVVEPSAVGEAIAGALASGKEEVFVPREIGLPARLIAGLPARPADALKRALRADRVIADADRPARADYERRIER
jgi:NAD(P)-dependent dehydrogenase (short-subunit alcohol dehydrogenase family)